MLTPLSITAPASAIDHYSRTTIQRRRSSPWQNELPTSVLGSLKRQKVYEEGVWVHEKWLHHVMEHTCSAFTDPKRDPFSPDHTLLSCPLLHFDLLSRAALLGTETLNDEHKEREYILTTV